MSGPHMAMGLGVVLAALIAAPPVRADRSPASTGPAQRVQVSPLEVDGAIDPLDIERAVRARLVGTHHCKPGGASDPNWHAAISFSVLSTGHLVGLKVVGPTKAISQCLHRALSKLTFDKQRRATAVDSTWYFGAPKAGVDRQTAIEEARRRGVLGVLAQPKCTSRYCTQPHAFNHIAAGDRRRITRTLKSARKRIGSCLPGGAQARVYIGFSDRGRVNRVTVDRGRPDRERSCLSQRISRLPLRARRVHHRQKPQFNLLVEHRQPGVLVGGALNGRLGHGRRSQATAIVRPRVKLYSVRTRRGAINTSLVRRTLQANLRNFLICYQRELQRRPSLSGTVNVDISVNAAGKVQNVKARFKAPPVARCVERTLRTVSFPASGTKTAALRLRLAFDLVL